MDRADLEHWSRRDVARLLALLEAERQYHQQIVAAVACGIAVLRRDGAILSANGAIRSILGVESRSLLQCSISGFVSSPQFRNCLDDVIRDGVSHSNIPVTVAGRALRASLAPLAPWDSESEREAVLTLLPVDVAEEAGATQLPNVPAVLWNLNRTTLQFESVHGRAEQLLGYPEAHWISTPDFLITRVHADDRDRVAEFYRSAVRHHGVFACEFRAVNGAQQPVWCRDIFEVSDGALIAGLTVENGARRHLEAGSLQASRVDALAGLARKLAHELNNSLMIVTGYAEELRNSFGEDDSRRSDVEAILSAAESMAGVTGELQGFTRTQAAPPASIEITSLLTELSQRIRDELGATLVCRLPHSPLSAYAAADQLEAVLFSLARRLRDKSDPHMILTVSETPVRELSSLPQSLEPGSYVEIALRGPFASEVAASEFETLIAGRSPHASDLARAFAIVREWGGTIVALRTEYASEIRLLLPAVAQPKAAAALPAPPPPAAEPVEVPVDNAMFELPGRNVLVVDDEAGIRGLVRRILERESYHVIEAEEAAEAIELVRREHPSIDLLVTDIDLPGRSGRELADLLAEMYPSLRVLFVSGFTDEAEGRTHSLPAGAIVLQKPFTLASLMRRVREVMEG